MKEKLLNIVWSVRCSVASNPNTPQEVLTEFAKDSNCDVRVCSAYNPNTPQTFNPGDKIRYDTAPSCMGKGIAYYIGIFTIRNSQYYQIEKSPNSDRTYLIPIHSKIEKI